MITMPTRDFVGLITDVAGFALKNGDDFPLLNTIRIHWDGEILHTQAHDGDRAAWSTWSPEDTPDDDAMWGGNDDPWSVWLGLTDAINLARTFKLPAKLGSMPVLIDYRTSGAETVLRLARAQVPDHREITLSIGAAGVDTDKWPDMAAVFARFPDPEPVGELTFASPARIADFAKVRPLGPLTIHAGRQGGAVKVTVGGHFQALVRPGRVDDEDGGVE